MKHSLNDFDADVRDIAGQLSTVDFSAQSQQREAVRAQLIDQAEALHNPTPPMRSRPQPRGRLYAIMGTVAASLMLSIVFLMQAKAPAPMTEIILPVMPAAQPTDIPLEMLPRFYDTLEYAAAAVPRTVFAPSWLPEDYVFNFSALSSPAKSLTTLTSLYVKETPWRASLLEGFPPYRFTGDADYLYIAQEIDNPDGVSPIWNLPPEMSMTEEELPNIFHSRDASNDNSYRSFYKDQYKIVLWRADSEFFLLISRLLDYEELLKIAESLQPISASNVFVGEPGAPGSCDVSGPGEGGGLWTLPLQKDSYRPMRGFYSGHTGIDLEAAMDAPVYASNSGTIVFAGWTNWGYGNTIVISHGDLLTLYGHLNTVDVICGEVVEAGQKIGGVGSSGNSSGPHLHFELRHEGVPINPDVMFDF